MTIQTTRISDRGVSESIGFLLIFTIVIAGIGLVTLYGYPLLLQQQVSADEKIMEKNMIVLQNDVKSLAYKTVPFKETSLKIGGGSLTVYNSTMDPTVFTVTDPAGVDPFQTGELLYESVSAQTNISLQNGAVVMSPRTGSGSVMLSEPRWFYDQKTGIMVINFINITSTSLMAKEGIGTVQMTLGETNYTSITGLSQVVVKYSGGYPLAWENYLTRTLGMTTSGPSTYTLTPVNTLIIKRYEVQIKNI